MSTVVNTVINTVVSYRNFENTSEIGRLGGEYSDEYSDVDLWSAQ
jgi:hypothetical protein